MPCTPAFGKSDVGDAEFLGQCGHGVGLHQVVQFLAGEGDVVGRHQGVRVSESKSVRYGSV